MSTKNLENKVKAPLFDLNDQNGNQFKLEDHIGKKYVVLFFYPKDNTRVCTKEVCMFRDYKAEFESLDATIIGISKDGQKSHKGFSDSFQLNYPILSDKSGEVFKKYGIKNSLFFIPGRETFVIDKNGDIVNRFREMSNHEGHVKEALDFLKNLKDT